MNLLVIICTTVVEVIGNDRYFGGVPSSNLYSGIKLDLLANNYLTRRYNEVNQGLLPVNDTNTKNDDSNESSLSEEVTKKKIEKQPSATRRNNKGFHPLFSRHDRSIRLFKSNGDDPAVENEESVGFMQQIMNKLKFFVDIYVSTWNSILSLIEITWDSTKTIFSVSTYPVWFCFNMIYSITNYIIQSLIFIVEAPFLLINDAIVVTYDLIMLPFTLFGWGVKAVNTIMEWKQNFVDKVTDLYTLIIDTIPNLEKNLTSQTLMLLNVILGNITVIVQILTVAGYIFSIISIGVSIYCGIRNDDICQTLSAIIPQNLIT